MSDTVRSFIGTTITESGQVNLKGTIDVNPGECVYMLLKTNCIEIRTKAQHEALLKKLSKLSKLSNDDKYKRLYANLFTYSKALPFNSRGMITLGREIVVNRRFDKRIIIEKCDGYIRLWHPLMFKKELESYAGYNEKIGRSK